MKGVAQARTPQSKKLLNRVLRRASRIITADDDDDILSRTNTPSQIHMHAHITQSPFRPLTHVIHGTDKNLLKQANGSVPEWRVCI